MWCVLQATNLTKLHAPRRLNAAGTPPHRRTHLTTGRAVRHSILAHACPATLLQARNHSDETPRGTSSMLKYCSLYTCFMASPSPLAGLSAFLVASPTPYQMCAHASKLLLAAGFTELKEEDGWAQKSALRKGGRYFFTRAASTLVAFSVGGAFEAGNGFKVVGAHTDSPVLKVKPVSKKSASGYQQLGVECYGGGLWHTWFDRELSLAGCVIVSKPGGGFERKLVHIQKPLMRIPSLCIHLQTADERAKLEVNKETHLVPIVAMINNEINKTAAPGDNGADDRHAPELLKVIAEEAGCKVEDIRDMDITLYDTQPGSTWGNSQEFFSAARLDNQVHCFTGLEALIAHCEEGSQEGDSDVSVLVCFDHEEVGSDSTHGAGSPIMKEIVERVNTCFGVDAGGESFKLSLRKSFVISADVAHAVHPNYSSKHETNHGPLLNKGTVIKTNNNQRYATSATTGFVIRELSRQASVGVQEFVVRNVSHGPLSCV